MKLISNKLYSDDGRLIKNLNCPYGYFDAEIQNPLSKNPLCENCKRSLINTDHYSEAELEEILASDASTCLLINPFNPMFKRCSK
jgi:hypothetical protein